MSVEAFTWALNLAPVPMDDGGRGEPKPNSACAFVLTGLANHAGPDGRDAFPGVNRLKRYTRLSERTIRTALDRLEDEGIIVPGDADVLAAKVKRGDRRPAIYDLDMSRMRADLSDAELLDIARENPWLRPWVEQHRPDLAGRPRGATTAPRESSRVPRGATDVPHGVQLTHSRGAAVAPKPPKEPSKEPSTTNLADVGAADDLVEVVVGALPTTLRVNTTRRALRAACRVLVTSGWTPETLRPALAEKNWAGARHGGAVVGWLGDLGRPPAAPAPAPGCDQCTRGWLGEDAEGRPRPCPTCRPSSGRVSA